jgi:hypothetical protein
MKGSQEITFLGGINTDDDVRFVTQGDYRSSMYTRSGSAESQNAGALESMPGNIEIPNENLPSGINQVVGSAKWLENESIIYFVYNSNSNHTIWSYSISTQEITQVIGNITGGYAGTALNFDPEYKIFHTNVVDNILYWTDGTNPPRKLDLYKAIKYFESEGTDAEGYPFLCFNTEYISSYTMDVVKAPPTFVIQGEYITNQNKNFNKLYGNQYQFRYQYVYENNEESKWSMISKQPFPPSEEFISGRDIRDSLKYNEIELTYFTGAYNVKQINFAFRRGENGSWLIFKQLDLQTENVPNAIINTLVFDDNVAPQGATLTDILYDNVPQTALCQEILPNQSLAYGNFYADYDLLPQIDIQGERVLNELYDANNSYFPLIKISNVSEHEPYPLFRYNAYINFQNSLRTFDFIENDLIIISLAQSPPSTYLTAPQETEIENYYYSVTNQDVSFSGTTLEKIQNLVQNIQSYFSVNYGGQWVLDNDSLAIIGYFKYVYPRNETAYVLRKNRSSKSLKKGSKKVFGIQYYDRANRSNAVQTTPEMIIDVPLPGQELGRLDFQYNIDPQGYYGSASAYTVSSKFTINHLPPDWATHYSILVKKDELISSFMQTTVTDFSYDPIKPFLVSLTLDKVPNSTNVDYYTSSYKNATFYHTPSPGDRIRFITKENYVSPYPFDFPSLDGQFLPNPYLNYYLELDVIEYNPETNSILVNDFNFQKILGFSCASVGALVEIYTPKKDVAEDVWFEIETFPIYTGNDGIKYHQANDQFQTDTQPAILTSDYGDVYYRMRDLASGIYKYTKIEDNVCVYTKSRNYWNVCNGIFIWNGYENIQLSIDDINVNIIENKSYFIEDYNYSDYYVSDGHGRGRIGIENNKTKRTHYKTGVIHSAPYVMGSYINGLSSFDTLGNAEYLDDTFGPINRLKQVGYTLKALQNRKETSIYIQRAYATSADGSGQLAYTSKTFGGINPSETLFGCIHPGSVQVIENDMYYYDFYTGAIVRSSANGQYDVTSGKYKFNYWISTKTNDITKNEYKTLYGKTYRAVYTPIALVDEQNTEYTLNFVKTYVLDKRFPNLPIEVYDSNIGPTFNYSEDRWKMFIDYDLYWAENLGINVFSFNGANLYEHNVSQLADETPNELTFYGEQKTMSVEFIMNDSAIIIKRPLSIGFRSNKKFSMPSITTQATASYPAMKSMLYPNSFKLKEGYWWSAYLRDMNTPNKTEEQGLMNGRELRGYAIIHKAEYSSNEKAVLFDVKCSYIGSEALI